MLSLPTAATAANFHGSTLPDQGPGSTTVAVADFNGDSVPDLASATSPTDGGEVRVSIGDGTGGFGPSQIVGQGIEPSTVAAGDLNGDGRPDLAVTFAGDRDDRGPGSIVVYLNTGAGFAPQPPVAVGDEPIGITIAELTGDARLDAAIFDDSFEVKDVTILVGDGAGGLAPHSAFPAGTCPDDLEAADVEPDGDTDLVVADRCEQRTTILESNGSGAFAPLSVSTLSASSIEVADMNSDGRQDLVYATGSSRSLGVQLAEGAGYGAPVEARFGIRHAAIEVADLDRDGDLDVVAGEGLLTFNETAQLEVRLGDGTGRLSGPTAFAGEGGRISGRFRSGTLAIADLNRDGLSDAISSGSPYAIFLGADQALPRCGGLEASIVGRDRDDGLKGTRSADVVVGGGGSDFVDGFKGNDIICGGGDRDFLDGGQGNDEALGGADRDGIAGDLGDDVADGGGGNDQVAGGEGNDDLEGGPGFDRCTGGKGKDSARSCEKTTDTEL